VVVVIGGHRRARPRFRGVPVLALWSAPRARSTAFFRSVLERGDVVVAHEPFSDLFSLGETDTSDGTVFTSVPSFLAWLVEAADDRTVFLKDTPDHRHRPLFDDRWFRSELRHAFLIRRPEEIAASFYAVEPAMTVDSIGLEVLWELFTTVVADAGPHPPVVIDADDLVASPAGTMTAYCAAVGLPFVPAALSWRPGDRPEWRRSARWHREVSTTTGFVQRAAAHAETVETSAELARFTAHHRPSYELLRAHRLPPAL
jgi:hypothetical protein